MAAKPTLERRGVKSRFTKLVRNVDPRAILLKMDRIAGWPDYFVLWSDTSPWGRGLSMVELKREGQKLRPLQETVHRLLAKVTGVKPVTLVGEQGVSDWIETLCGETLPGKCVARGYSTAAPAGTVLFRTLEN